MASFKKFPVDHRQNGRFVETLPDRSRVFLEIWPRNRHPRGSELVKLHMNMQMGRATGYYVEETQVSLFFERRQRVDVEVLPQGYRYGRYFERTLRGLCEKVADALAPQPKTDGGRDITEMFDQRFGELLDESMEGIRQASGGRGPDEGGGDEADPEDDAPSPAMR
ncbi:hypothetical protein [Rhizobium leguminosarum]|uniref:hypothetical protein n=1 Tax=Rhizobium leguminosarum TaxID=384 RepID=UPI002E0E3B05|nr:hypothetical protein U8Q02_43050 [Rhizobium leguminosarum]